MNINLKDQPDFFIQVFNFKGLDFMIINIIRFFKNKQQQKQNVVSKIYMFHQIQKFQKYTQVFLLHLSYS
ncbi:unnamed protein product [Paramecium pentaurelia]|uniref:Transmembrane protein n=1 Tax=Paramecium pentaurelia TaxID=43138 RepID=A0A8S1Y0R2_9CILI|nr:unnamed protein product [Paramecium pentaurelia]